MTCIKILLLPTYRSTDFDVHRQWLAVTKQLPLKQWYFDNANGTTVHTLDYPPNFAYWEWILANNPITTWYLGEENDDKNNDDHHHNHHHCLSILPDHDNEPSEQCVIFQRTTVMISDIILWYGAYVASTAYHYYPAAAVAAAAAQRQPSSSTTASTARMTSFLLIVLNPGLLWIDHVHFQYNGMLLGMLLLSLGWLFQGNNFTLKSHHGNNNNNITTTTNNNNNSPPNPYSSSSSTSKRKSLQSSSNWYKYHGYHLAGAAMYATLCNFKHLYLPLAPLYFCWILEKYCLHRKTKRFLLGPFISVAIVTLLALILPWIPFVYPSSSASSSSLWQYDNDDNNNNIDNDHAMAQLLQIARRLFPFGRGLVHDYWAANVWAVYVLLDKVLQKGLGIVGVEWIPEWMIQMMQYCFNWKNSSSSFTTVSNTSNWTGLLPEVTPGFCALLLFLSMIPAMQMASLKLTNFKLVQGVVYTSLCTYMLAYHVHEKAILTTMIPLALLVGRPPISLNSSSSSKTTTETTKTVIVVNSKTGEKTQRKVTLRRPGSDPNNSSLSLSLSNHGNNTDTTMLEIHNLLYWQMTTWGLLSLFPLLYEPTELCFKVVSYLCYLGLTSYLLQTPPQWNQSWQYFGAGQVGIVILILEVLPVPGKWEFLPLLITSISCASGLIGCWTLSLWILIKPDDNDDEKRKRETLLATTSTTSPLMTPSTAFSAPTSTNSTTAITTKGGTSSSPSRGGTQEPHVTKVGGGKAASSKQQQQQRKKHRSISPLPPLDPPVAAASGSLRQRRNVKK
jgi:alpha-1,3-glucosyltransferase